MKQALSKGEKRRVQIVETAISLLASEGISRTKAADVAKKLGIRPSLVFYHFKTNQDLHNAMIAHIVLTNNHFVNQAMAKAPSTPIDQVRAYCKATLRWGVNYPAHVSCFLYNFAETLSKTGTSELVQKALHAGSDKLMNLLGQGVMAGALRLRCSHETVEIVHDTLTGCVIKNFLQNKKTSELSEKKIDELIQYLIETKK